MKSANPTKPSLPTIAIAAHAEGEVVGSFEDENFADELAIGGKNLDAITRAGPDAAIGIGADAIGTTAIDFAKDFSLGDGIAGDVEDADVPRLAGISNV